MVGADLLTELPEKVLSQCGLLSGILALAVVGLSWRLAKALAIIDETNAYLLKIIGNLAHAEDRVGSIRRGTRRGGGNDDD